MRRFIFILIALVFAAVSGPAAAQFDQYREPGEFEERRESMDALLERSMEEARWRLGKLYVDPWIGLRDVAWSDNAATSADGEPISDFTATVGAGVRAYVPLSSITLALHALPEYVWWQDLDERSRLNGRYGVGLFGDLGRTGIELTARRREDAQFVSREIQERVNTRDDRARLALEFDIGRLALFGSADLRRIRFSREQESLANLPALERDEEVLQAGLRLHLPADLTVGLGVEHSEVDFLLGGLSNSGTSPLVQLDFDRRAVSFSAQLAFRDLEAEVGSAFVPYDGTTGDFQLSWRTPLNRLALELFGDRNLVYSPGDRWAYFEDTGVGAAVRLGLSSRLNIRVFAQEGTTDYTAFAARFDPRSDDYESVGGELSSRLGRFTLLLGASETRYESSLPEFDRTITVISSGFRVRGAGSPWG